MEWQRILSYITGSVDEDLRVRNEYLAAENRIFRSQIPGRVPLDDSDRAVLAEIGKRLGLNALRDLATIVKPETILAWHRNLIAKKFDGSANRKPGRPRVSRQIEDLVVRLAQENKGWGYDKIAGALANLGHEISDQTVGNILKRRGIPPAPYRKKTTTWAEFISSHREVLAATDFFTVEVWTLKGLVTHYVLLFIHLATRRVELGGITVHPNEAWMMQVARNSTMTDWGFLSKMRYLLHDGDSKYCRAFRRVLKDGGVQPLTLPWRSPNLNAFAERWIRSVKEECLSQLIFFGPRSLTRALDNYVQHHQRERNHQGLHNMIPFPSPDDRVGAATGAITRRKRLGGLLNFYLREAA